jgi:hypothetical protein
MQDQMNPPVPAALTAKLETELRGVVEKEHTQAHHESALVGFNPGNLAGPLATAALNFISREINAEAVPPVVAALNDIKSRHPGVDIGAIETAIQNLFGMVGLKVSLVDR